MKNCQMAIHSSPVGCETKLLPTVSCQLAKNPICRLLWRYTKP